MAANPLILPPQRAILCIDPGSNLGYAAFDTDGYLFEYGQLKTNLKNTQEQRLYEMESNISTLFSHFEPGVVVMENVLTAAYQLKSKDAVLWLVGTYTITCVLTAEHNVGLVTVLPNVLKKHVTGKGNATKHLMIDAVNKRFKLNLKKSEHNKADALGLGIYYVDNCSKNNLPNA